MYACGATMAGRAPEAEVSPRLQPIRPLRNAVTAACARSEADSFERMSATWPFTVPRPRCSRSPISALPTLSAISDKISVSRGVSGDCSPFEGARRFLKNARMRGMAKSSLAFERRLSLFITTYGIVRIWRPHATVKTRYSPSSASGAGPNTAPALFPIWSASASHSQPSMRLWTTPTSRVSNSQRLYRFRRERFNVGARNPIQFSIASSRTALRELHASMHLQARSSDPAMLPEHG